MRVVLGSLAVTLLVTPARGQDRSADETAVRNRVAAATSALNRRDGAAFGALFSADADVIVLANPRTHGRPAIQAVAAKDWAAAPNERATITPTEIRFVGADVAIANTVGRFTGGATPSEDRGTWVLYRESGGWVITALRVMPAPKP